MKVYVCQGCDTLVIATTAPTTCPRACVQTDYVCVGALTPGMLGDGPTPWDRSYRIASARNARRGDYDR